MPTDITPAPGVPMIAHADPHTRMRFLEFFTANIRNPNTRRAYWTGVSGFLTWCEAAGLRDLTALKPIHVAAWVEQETRRLSAPSVKQRLAAVRMLFDWLVVGQVLPFNPAAAVRGPKHSTKRGKTPALSVEDARALFDSIPSDSLVGRRDRALLGVMTYAFARVGAALTMRVEDYYPNGKRWWVRLHEKGGKLHELPCHHSLEAAFDAYLEAAGIGENRKGWLFRTAAGRTGVLTENPMRQPDAWSMIRRRAKAAGILTPIGCHTFRATGITAYLENGGTLERAQAMAAHESPRTTKLYDRTADAITLDEVERIGI